MTRQLGIGLISVGWMGRAHSRAYRNVHERFPDLGARPRLVVAADVAESGRSAAVEELGYERATADWREVIADPEVDAVSICAPNFLHREMAIAAAEAGKPFWIEKPMGISLEESTQIADAAAAAGVVTAVGFSYRHAPIIARARELVRSGRIGRVTNVRVGFVADYSADAEAPLTWRYARARAGSGVLGDLLSHGFHLAEHVVGEIAELVADQSIFIAERPIVTGDAVGHAAQAGTERGTVENEDYSAIIAHFAGGAVGVFESSRVSTGSRSEYTLEVHGTLGTLRWDFTRMNELEIATRDDEFYGFSTVLAGPADGEFSRFQPGPGIPMGFDDLKTIEASHFLRSVVTGEQDGPSVADGRRAAQLVDAAERSAASRGWVAAS
ncbi:Gfo/Idh/MocA family oxidoreductase [Schumannella luteola]|uniref:Putative dehydrogenase n=1 Tax=Schumannella luteola TaxID=472059 RepID=A0A852YSS8_9MICO|nr:Gfo/Idh/MocA family oxidoreductase [Schumannella luteola]NYH00750.1 putative dehydrogenase [Schumannella luteola]TPX03961.1 Gfo/Idh/MocA family oxidoreductase [Schumannella luteola]